MKDSPRIEKKWASDSNPGVDQAECHSGRGAASVFPLWNITSLKSKQSIEMKTFHRKSLILTKLAWVEVCLQARFQTCRLPARTHPAPWQPHWSSRFPVHGLWTHLVCRWTGSLASPVLCLQIPLLLRRCGLGLPSPQLPVDAPVDLGPPFPSSAGSVQLARQRTGNLVEL